MSMTGKMATCLACHLVNGTGRDFGPDLSYVGARLTREQLLESIHTPSKSIAKGYETWTVTLMDGTQQTGFLVHRSGKELTLKLATGQPLSIPNAQIISQKLQPLSLMPEGLLQAMTEQEAADMLAFLSHLKK
jgi:putative heme-binding domain-containing protein